jgi:hypothetical protein
VSTNISDRQNLVVNITGDSKSGIFGIFLSRLGVAVADENAEWADCITEYEGEQQIRFRYNARTGTNGDFLSIQPDIPEWVRILNSGYADTPEEAKEMAAYAAKKRQAKREQAAEQVGATEQVNEQLF